MTSLNDWISGDIPDVVMDDAAAWLALLDAERCTEADRLAFARWLDEDSCHRWAFEELSEIWARLRTLADAEPLLEHDKVVPFRSRAPSPRPARARVAGAPVPSRRDWSTLAACLVVALGVGAHFLAAAPTQAFSTATGEDRQVVLADGSTIELNARTTVRVSLQDNRRSIELVAGEAVFHVAPDERPFIVSTEHGSVAALGTTFNVEVLKRSLEVAVIEGTVAVNSANEAVPLTEYDDAAVARLSDRAALLTAGDWIEVSGSGFRQPSLGTEEFRRQLSWRTGVVEFEDKPLLAAVEEMRRYSHASIHVVDSELGGLRISGRFETGNSIQFLQQLNEKYGVIIDDASPDWILLRASPPDRVSGSVAD